MANHPHNKNRPEPAGIRKALEKNDMEALALRLTARQRAFCHEYVVDFDGKAAAIRAGYSINYADRQAYLLRKHKGVQAYIDHLTHSKEAKLMSISPDYVLNRITEIVNKEGVKDNDALRGLELLARHLGMFIERQEITGKDGGAIAIEKQEIAQEAESFTHLIKSLSDRNKDKTLN